MLTIGLWNLPGKLLVGRQHRTKGVEDILASLLAGPALTHRAGHLKDACDDPAVLSGLSKEIVKSTDAAMWER